jgi:hypothetical protein
MMRPCARNTEVRKVYEITFPRHVVLSFQIWQEAGMAVVTSGVYVNLNGAKQEDGGSGRFSSHQFVLDDLVRSPN